MPLWTKKDKKPKHDKHHPAVRKRPSPVNGNDKAGNRHSTATAYDWNHHDATSPSRAPPSASMQNLSAAIASGSPVRVAVPPASTKAYAYGETNHSRLARVNSGSVKSKREIYEAMSGNYSQPTVNLPPPTPEKRRVTNDSSASSISLSIPSLSGSTPLASTENLAAPTKDDVSRLSGSAHSAISPASSRVLSDYLDTLSLEIGKEKTFDGQYLPLPPLQTTMVRHRSVNAVKNAPGGGFGFILRKSYLPVPEDPDKTCLVHLIEPRSDYLGPLMTGDRIIEVNGESVEDAPHEMVVEMIKASGDSVELRVASMPELLELNARGALDDAPSRNAPHRRSGRMKPGSTGTLRRKAHTTRKEFKAKSVEEVLSEREGLEQERVWVVHREGFSLGTVIHDSPSSRSNFSTHPSLMRYNMGRETHHVKLEHVDEPRVIDVDEEDVEKANPPGLDKVEDVTDLLHLNEPSVLHVLRQRYGSSLIHTFAGKHLLIINPIRPLSSYVDRVIEMFRGCRREDMPPHIFAMGQQAYRDMMVTRSDQSLILLGLSGSGKTFNARYLLRYLATVSQPDLGPVSNAKLDAIELLLHSFSSAATFLNSQATRCTCLYTLEFDPSGLLVGALVRTFLLERRRVADKPEGEGNFNIFYQLMSGADEQLKNELMFNVPVDTEEKNLYLEPHDDPQRVESAAYVWDLIQNCLEILGISEEEALGLWSLLAAIYHLGFAGVKKGSTRGTDCFLNPAAAQRAATVLGINQEDLARDIFNPPRGTSMRLNSLFSPPGATASPTGLMGSGESSSLLGSIFGSFQGSPTVGNSAKSRNASLDAFVTGLYDQTFNALVMLINRSLQPPAGVKGRSSIHVLDTPGFQHRELAGVRNGATLDELCMNYEQERLQMLFHDSTFTSEQDRYIQEDINWMFSEVAVSPLALIDTIDKHVPQRRGINVDLHSDKRGLLWILDEEAVFPGASDSSFLERVHMYHGELDEKGDPPLIKVLKEENQFQVYHCQRSLPVLYDANGWVRRAREHPSFKVTVQVVAESKKPSIAAIFQGRGVAASATNISTSALKADTSHHGTLGRSRSSQTTMIYSSPSSGIKKNSVCLQSKFQLDFLIDLLRKSHQWYIHCILPQPPFRLPGALPSPDPQLQKLAGPPPQGQVDVPLVRAQLRRADIVKAARIYKQGFPEHMSFPEFRRRYGTLLDAEYLDGSAGEKDVVEQILASQAVDKFSYKLGLSQVFFRAGILSQMDRQVEDTTHDTLVLFQARCRGWLGRQKLETLQVQHSAAIVIQQNVLSYLEVREWSWWELFVKVKPLLAMWRTEEEMRKKNEKIDKLKGQTERLEAERTMFKQTERVLEEKVEQMTIQVEELTMSANQASELLENEQLEKRHLQEQLAEISSRETELAHEREQLNLQIAEMSILARIKQDEEGDEGEGSVLEKYWEAKRELETLRQRISTEQEDVVERLESTKRSLEKKLADSESEREDLHKNLSQLRKKANKQATEFNDLQLHLETQQARNAELEKRQRKFDSDLNASKDEATTERLAKEKLAREKDTLHSEFEELEEKIKELQEENHRIRQEKEDLEAEVLSQTSRTTESELTSLKKIKRELTTKVEELEDELDEANIRLDTLQQTKARLEISSQTTKQQHQKELEARDEEVEQIKNAMNKKVKALSEQIEELHEEKQTAVKARRDLERELMDHQSKQADPEVERRLKKKVQKYKAVLMDLQDELEHERDMRGNSAILKSLRNQLEDLQASETTAVKAQKRLQGEVDDLQVQTDELSRAKMELDARVSELTRDKSDLESRVEEDQDEIEELLGKQRSHISQVSGIQAQLTEAHTQVEELQEAKQQLETKVSDLNAKLSEMESGINRQQYEASEFKVRELEQKLELEKASARRHESQIQRLRNQLERLQDVQREDVTTKSGDTVKRLQKQLRDLRVEFQEAERKEQEQAKKRRQAETQSEELQVQLQTAQADLKSAQKRIDTLHKALKGQEEGYGSSGEEEYSPSKRDNSLNDDLSSSGSSYKIGEYGASSDDEGTFPRRTAGRLGTPKRYGVGGGDFEAKSRRSRSRDLDEEFEPNSRRKDYSIVSSDEDDIKVTTTKKGYSKYEISDDDDDLDIRRKKDYGSKVSDDEDDLKFSSRRRTNLSSDDDDLTSFRTRRNRDGDDLGVADTARRRERIKISDDDDDDDDFLLRRKKPTFKVSDDEDEPSARLSSRRDRSADLASDDIPKPARQTRIKLSDDDDDDLDRSSSKKRDFSSGRPGDKDDILKKAEKHDVRFNGTPETSSPRHAAADLKTSSGRSSEEPLEKASTSNEPPSNFDAEQRPSLKDKLTDDQQAVHSAAAMRRRRRQRRRTVEAETRIGSNPTSPQHQRANGDT